MQAKDGRGTLPDGMQAHIWMRVGFYTLIATIASLLITLGVSFYLSDAPPDTIGIFIALFTPAVITPCASYLTVSLSCRLQIANKRLQALSETDSLTGTLNRRKFMEVAESQLGLAERYGFSTSLVLVDFDEFKGINDVYGHAAGDCALVQAIDVIKSVIRESDLLARFGGEEFILLLPHTDLKGAKQLMDRVLTRVAKTPVKYHETSIMVTLSAGLVTCENSVTPLDVMMSTADELLYLSKQHGRNRCTAKTLGQVMPKIRQVMI